MGFSVNNKILFFVLIVIASVAEAAGDIFLKQWSSNSKTWLFLAGIAIYVVAIIFFGFSLRQEYLSKAVVVINIINLLVILLAGVLIFNEKLSSVNKIGVALAIVSIALIEFF